MSLATTKEMLKKAQAEGYAVGAFNAENMEMMQAIIEAAEEAKAPVIIQTTPSTVKYASPSIFAANACAMAEKAKVPVAMHLDHGSSAELCREALGTGYTSVMIDGSKMSFEDNISVTASVVEMAKDWRVPVEAELGAVGGKEDSHEAEEVYTVPSEAAEFEKRTGIDSLAVAIGTAHGFYKDTPVLDVERLKEIRRATTVPLVLHGASGLSAESIRECVKNGICKVNFATELRVAYTEGVREALSDSAVFDVKVYGRAGKAKVKALVLEKMNICGCIGKA